jgi:hypothetical protein
MAHHAYAADQLGQRDGVELWRMCRSGCKGRADLDVMAVAFAVCLAERMMRIRILGGWLVLACLGCVGSLCVPGEASAQAGFISGGFLYDIKRYSGDESQNVYDGQAAGGFVGVGAFVAKRLSAEFEMGLSRDTTTTVSTPVVIAGMGTVDFNTVYTTRLQTYSALFAVHTAPSERLHLSYRGGVTFVHHRREILPPNILPVNPQTPSTIPATPTVLIENVAGPTAGIDADVILSQRFAIVGALRVHAFRIATDLSAFSIRPMVGARVTF